MIDINITSIPINLLIFGFRGKFNCELIRNMEYTFIEYADMHLMYGLASCNALEARRLYHERFPNRTVPNHKTFQRVDQRLRENGKFEKKSTDAGVRRTVRTVQLEENILNAVDDNPSTSTRKLAAQFNTSKTIAHEVLQEQLLYPYHLQKTHQLIPEDFPRRMQFSNWLVDQQRNNVNFISTILFTDEAGFTKNGIINLHNSHIWADENPHATIVAYHQHQFQSINIWAGVIGNFLIGPFVLPARLNGELYLEFLQNAFQDLIEHLPLETRRNMYFMHDGAPPHFSVAVREHLNNVYPNRWIGRGGPISWPPRSPDLTPMDFYLWGHLKTLVYSTPVNSREELLRRITFHCDMLRNNAGLWWRVQQSSIRRARECIRVNGAHVEPTYKVFN